MLTNEIINVSLKLTHFLPRASYNFLVYILSHILNHIGYDETDLKNVINDDLIL